MLWRILSVLKNLKRVGFALLLLGVNVSAFAQPPDTLWTRVYSDLALVESTAVLQDIHSIKECPNGDLVAVGYSSYYPPGTPENDSLGGLVLKVSANGDLQWQTFLRGPTRLSDVAINDDGSMYVVGYIVINSLEWAYVSLISTDGDTIWTDIAPIDSSRRLYDLRLQRTISGDLLLSGSSRTPDTFLKRVFLAWLNEEADTIRVRYYTPVEQQVDPRNTRVTVLEQGYLLSFDAGSCGPFYVISVSTAGDSLSSIASSTDPCVQSFGSPFLDELSHVFVARNGLDAGFSKIDSNGTLLWHRHYNPWRALNTPLSDNHGGFILAAQDDSQFYRAGIVRIDTAGVQQWWSFASVNNADLRLQADLLRLNNGDYAVAGVCEYFFTHSWARFAFISRFDAPVFSNTIDAPVLPKEIEISVFPSPFNSTTEISFEMPRAALATIKVYDVLGREQATLLDDVMQGGTRSVMWNAEGFASGIYFVRLSVGNVGVTKKVALIK